MERPLNLIWLDAFCFTGKQKAQLLWEAHLLLNHSVPDVGTRLMFQAQERKYVLPELEYSVLADAYDEIEYTNNYWVNTFTSLGASTVVLTVPLVFFLCSILTTP